MHFLDGAFLYAFGPSAVQTIPRLAVMASFENYRELQPFYHSMEQQLAMGAVQVLKAVCGPLL